MFIVCLSNVGLSLSIFAFTLHHVAHSFVLSICFFHFDPHILIFNYLSGSSRVGSLGYSKGGFIILHILSNMFKIKVYSVIISKVFGLTIGVKFFLPL